MRIFYSELAENPTYYSFGYSVYATLEDEDSIKEAFNKGFLPCIIAQDQSKRLMYQTRGVRILAQEFIQRHYHLRVARKVSEIGEITGHIHEKNSFVIDEDFYSFFLNYFSFRFGADSMPRDRLKAILDSEWITHISEYRLSEKPVAYMLEHHSESLIHVWYQAYDKEYESSHLGSYAYTSLIERAKREKKTYVYFGVSYGPWMRYKANFTPLEYWDGSNWIRDENGKRLKTILDEGIRPLALVDRWRNEQKPFYAPPTLSGLEREMRFLTMMLEGAPRSSFFLLFGLFICIGIIIVLL